MRLISHLFLGGFIGALMTIALTGDGRVGMLGMEAAGTAGAFIGSAVGIEVNRRWHVRFARIILACLGAAIVLSALGASLR